jgi:hypothetical protein
LDGAGAGSTYFFTPHLEHIMSELKTRTWRKQEPPPATAGVRWLWIPPKPITGTTAGRILTDPIVRTYEPERPSKHQPVRSFAVTRRLH